MNLSIHMQLTSDFKTMDKVPGCYIFPQQVKQSVTVHNHASSTHLLRDLSYLRPKFIQWEPFSYTLVEQSGPDCSSFPLTKLAFILQIVTDVHTTKVRWHAWTSIFTPNSAKHNLTDMYPLSFLVPSMYVNTSKGTK